MQPIETLYIPMNQTIYLPASLLAELKQRAEAEQRSLSNLIRCMIKKALAESAVWSFRWLADNEYQIRKR